MKINIFVNFLQFVANVSWIRILLSYSTVSGLFIYLFIEKSHRNWVLLDGNKFVGSTSPAVSRVQAPTTNEITSMARIAWICLAEGLS